MRVRVRVVEMLVLVVRMVRVMVVRSCVGC